MIRRSAWVLAVLVALAGCSKSPATPPSETGPASVTGSTSGSGASGSGASSPTEETGTLTGTWVGTWENDPIFGNPPANGGFTLTLDQKGGNVSGTGQVTGETCVGHVTIEGSVRGSTVELSLSGERNVSSFSAAWKGDSMSGT